MHSRPADKERKKTADHDGEDNSTVEHIEGMSEAGSDEEEEKRPKAAWKTLAFWKFVLPILFAGTMRQSRTPCAWICLMQSLLLCSRWALASIGLLAHPE